MSAAPEPAGALVIVTPPVLRERPLPAVGSTTHKGSRGRVLVVGGSDETPGGVLLAGLSALRSGAGTLQIATTAAVAPSLAVAVPEARVLALPSDPHGSIHPAAAVDTLADLLETADAVLVGTGTLDDEATGDLLGLVVPALGDETALLVDAGALPRLGDEPALVHGVAARTVVMPNVAEAARLLGDEPANVADGPEAAHVDLVSLLRCVVALRAPDTLVASPESVRYLDRSGHPALGTSGSGDVLAGVLAGLLARGADPLDAALWAVHLHGRAGEQAASRIGGQGILARELVDEIPRALVALTGSTT